MTEEPTTLMTVLDILLKIVIYVGVMGGFIFFLCLINALLAKFKSIGMVEGGSTFVGDREHRWTK